jgi:hypothetical protein
MLSLYLPPPNPPLLPPTLLRPGVDVALFMPPREPPPTVGEPCTLPAVEEVPLFLGVLVTEAALLSAAATAAAAAAVMSGESSSCRSRLAKA